jgi:acyl-CoA thioesterase I
VRIFDTSACFALILLSLMLATVGIGTAGDRPISIIALGDSYLSGYGLATADGFPAKLEAALKARGRSVTVINTGYHETTESGLSWLAKTNLLAQSAIPTTHGVILELGANDCMHSVNVDQSRANLDHILAQLAKERIPVLVVGTEAYANCGSDYIAGYDNAAYAEIFPKLAMKYGDLVYPSFKDGVTGHLDLLQGDDDHPNSNGVAMIVERILPSVESLIARMGQP